MKQNRFFFLDQVNKPIIPPFHKFQYAKFCRIFERGRVEENHIVRSIVDVVDVLFLRLEGIEDFIYTEPQK